MPNYVAVRHGEPGGPCYYGWNAYYGPYQKDRVQELHQQAHGWSERDVIVPVGEGAANWLAKWLHDQMRWHQGEYPTFTTLDKDGVYGVVFTIPLIEPRAESVYFMAESAKSWQCDGVHVSLISRIWDQRGLTTRIYLRENDD